MPLEAILLVGGKGTRLRPLTLSAPKPLLPTAGVPFLAHQLVRAAECGISHVVLATSYQAEMFNEAFGDGSQFGLSVEYVHEPVALGTGGGIRNAASRLHGDPGDPVVVLNGDILSAHDVRAQVAMHIEQDAAATLHLVKVDDPSRYGCVETDVSGRVLAFLEKTPNPPTNLINAGCYVFRRDVIDQMPAGRVVSVEKETFPELIASGQLLLGYPEFAYWLDVGTPQAFVQGSCDVVLGKMPSPAIASDRCGEALLLDGAMVAESAEVTGGTCVGAGARVGSGARVRNSVVFDLASIGEGASISDSIIGRGAMIGDGAVVAGAVIGDGVVVGPRNELTSGIRIWPGTNLGETSIRFSSDA
jgi:mannose-1-phosphate guanylyltransferase